MRKIALLFFTFSLSLFADAVYAKTYDQSIDSVYPKFKTALDHAHLITVAEIDILAKFKAAGLPKKFGKDFNTNNLTAIKAVVACNGGFGNAVANADPKMMAFCPVRITLIEKEGKTTILYVKATAANKNSKAYPTLEKLETRVLEAINGLK